MARIWLLAALALVSCSRENNNKGDEPRAAAPVVNDTKVNNEVPEAKKKTDKSRSQANESMPKIEGCGNAPGPGSDHNLSVSVDKATGKYLIDFDSMDDRKLSVISLYVTGMNDAVPVFPEFKFNGTAFWMIAAENPFTASFQLPILYGAVPANAKDVTARYKGDAGGSRIAGLTTPTCLKFTVITLEKEQEQPFKTSTFLQVHQVMKQ